MTDEGESPILRYLRVLWTHPIHFVVALLVGASGAFIYSYGPLHRSEQWQIGYLEPRVDEQNQGLHWQLWAPCFSLPGMTKMTIWSILCTAGMVSLLGIGPRYSGQLMPILHCVPTGSISTLPGKRKVVKV